MNTSVSEKRKSNQLSNSVLQKPFLSIDNEFTPQELYSILTKNPYLVNIEDEKNETFLSYAIKRNNSPIINLILTSPILNLTYQNNSGNTYLHLAVIQQNLILIQNLLDKGIFIDIQNNDGNTALHLAYYLNNLEIIKLLINNDIDFGIKNKKGLTAEEIDQTDNINEIAGYEVKLEKNYEVDENENNNLSLNQNEDMIFRSLKLSRNTGETKYNSQSSKDKKDSVQKKPENTISQFKDNKKKNKFKRISVEENKNKINKMLMNNSSDNNISNKEKEINAIKTKTISNISINDNSNENDSDKNLDNLKTIDNNFPIYEGPMHTSQDFAISDLDTSKKNNSSNFLDNNELNLSNNIIIENDNNTIQTEEFFCNEKVDNCSLISNIPIKDEKEKEKTEKNKNKDKKEKKNKKEEKVEKIIKCDNKPLYEFLMQIHMEKYYDNFNNNGFEFINMVIDDTKLGNHLTDKQLKDIGINIPGDRAKILIRFEEKANMFEFTIPKSVYYICYNLEKMEEDANICKLNGWLRNIRLDQYIRNFILNGYFSLDLLLVQSISKNPLTDDILNEEFGIKKLGHRARILNKLKEESKNFQNKLRESIMSFHTEDTNKICSECILC